MAYIKSVSGLTFWYPPGPYRRIIEPYEWSEETGWTQTVDTATAVDLITAPNEKFYLIEAPPAAKRALADALGVEPGNISVWPKPAGAEDTVTEPESATVEPLQVEPATEETE